MEYNKYFSLIIILSSISGILLGIFTNNINDSSEISKDIKFKEDESNKNKQTQKEEDKNDEKERDNNIDTTIENEKGKEIKEEKTDEKNTDKEKNENKEEKKEEDESNKQKIENEIEDTIDTEKIIDNPNKFTDNKTIIAVSYATDNKYIYPTIVAMTSLVYYAGPNTFYNIYILHTADFKEQSKNFLNTVEEKYPDKCAIYYFNMENKYKGLSLNFRIATPTYYRLSLHELLPDVDRIIWLDGDTLVFDDLTELIKVDMKGNFIMGFLDSVPDAIKSFGFKTPTVVCCGVLLMDLDGIRKYGYSKKISDFIAKNRHNLKQQDQTIINVVFQDRIAPIPPRYGIWAWSEKEVAKKHNDKQWPHLRYNETDLFEAIDHPAIVHFIWPKPFWRKPTRFEKEWWDFARLTGYYDDIYNKSPIPNIRWLL